MKLLNALVFHVLFILFSGSVASAQIVETSNSPGAGGLFQATQPFYNYPAWSGFYSGIDNNINYHDESALTAQLGCFPTGAQVNASPSTEWWTNLDGGMQLSNEWYLYVQNLSGTLAPGQSFTLKFRTCDAGGDQPFPQVTVFYQKISGAKTLTGYLVTPAGQKLNFNQASSTGGNYNAMSGGVIRNQGMPGVWTFVVSNPTRKPVQVYMGNFRMYLE
jgi:hypothetical protein